MNEELKEDILEITTNGEYKNIELKEKLVRNGLRLILGEDGKPQIKSKGIEDGKFIIVEKTFADCKEVETKFGKSYLAGVEYQGEKVSFWLKEFEAKAFNSCGGVGDKVRIRMEKKEKINPISGLPIIVQNLSFDLVE